MRVGSPPWTDDDLRSSLREFADLYSTLPIRDNTGGNNSVGLFYIWFCSKYLDPKVIIENGVWKGATTWLFETTVPDAQIYSLDPSLSKRQFLSSRAIYSDRDFSQQSWNTVGEKVLVFFDDHQNQLVRLTQSASFGFKYLLFDDNYPEFCSDRHLSLEAILEQRHSEGYDIPPGARDFLLSAIRTYYVFPPIFPHDQTVPSERSPVLEQPLFHEPLTQYEVYRRDMYTYRWTTFVELNLPVDMPLPDWGVPAYSRIGRNPLALFKRLKQQWWPL
jgi:hypothetical protein